MKASVKRKASVVEEASKLHDDTVCHTTVKSLKMTSWENLTFMNSYKGF